MATWSPGKYVICQTPSPGNCPERAGSACDERESCLPRRHAPEWHLLQDDAEGVLPPALAQYKAPDQRRRGPNGHRGRLGNATEVARPRACPRCAIAGARPRRARAGSELLAGIRCVIVRPLSVDAAPRRSVLSRRRTLPEAPLGRRC